MEKGILYLMITLIFFSSYEVVGKTLAGMVNPYQLNFIRFFFGGLILLPIAIKNLQDKKIKLSKRDIFFLALIGIVNVVISMSCLQLGINITKKASLAAVIFSSNPLFVALSAHFILNERLNIRKIIGMIIGIGGIVIVFYKDLIIGKDFIKGILLLILSAITYGVYTTMGKKFTQRSSSIIMNSFSFLFGSIFLLPIILLKRFSLFSMPLKAIFPMFYLTFFVTGIAYYTYFLGLTYTSAGAGSMIFFLKPILASIFASIFLSEKISINLILGTLVILLGIGIVQFADKKSLKILSKEHPVKP
ncbi:DMT family transporter [Caldicellulosiruptor sp. DIB 104C]|uniref:DMT family transporter n=1 Tax=Caldicellulosiruptor sp. DIB 104C TaxID=3019889 RepID=UPI00230536E9|nr:DMT family transporter [Caldicellulosiruptor sp. DIB 104C]